MEYAMVCLLQYYEKASKEQWQNGKKRTKELCDNNSTTVWPIWIIIAVSYNDIKFAPVRHKM